MVITNANIYEVEIDPKDVVLETGEIDPSKLKSKPKNWVAYNYALEDYLKFPQFVMAGYKDNDLSRPTFVPCDPEKRITFVVKSDYLWVFIKQLISEIYPH